MAYLDSSPPQDPSFLQTLAQALGLGGQPSPTPDRASLAAALSGQPAPAPPGTHYARLPGPPLLLPGDDGAAPAQPPLRQAAPPMAASPPAAPMRGSVADIAGVQPSALANAAVTPPPAAAAGAQSIVVPGYEAKGPLTRAQVTAAPDDDKTMPAEEDWDAAAAKAAKPTTGVQVAQAGQAAQPAQSAASIYEQALKSRYDQQEQLYNRFNAQAAAAKTPEVARIFAQQAAAALAEGNRILDEQQALLKPGTRTLSDAELTPTERAAGGEWQQSATGERSQVSGTAGDTTRAPSEAESQQIVAAGLNPKEFQVKDGQFIHTLGPTRPAESSEIQNYKFDQQDRQAKGLPPISFSDWNTQKTMYGKAERPLLDVNGKEIDSSATGDELLQTLPPAVANHAKAIAEIREKWPSGTEQARQPQLQQALVAAQQLDPSLNQQTYQTRQSMKNAAESGSGRINVANLANNTALFHSSTLADAIVALNNSNNTLLNATINSAAGPAGGIIPGAVTKADEVKQFDVARNAVSNELERSFHGVGTTAEQAVKRQIDDLSVNDAPQTQLGALKAAQDLLRGKIEANEADYRDTMGDRNIAAWERDHGRQFGFITPAARAAGDRVAMMYENVRAGKGFHGFEQQSASPSNPPAPASPSTQAAPKRGVYVPGQGIKWQ